jgi:hypothetical protein
VLRHSGGQCTIICAMSTHEYYEVLTHTSSKYHFVAYMHTSVYIIVDQEDPTKFSRVVN